VAHYVSGAGSEVRPVAQREFTRFAKSAAGFASVSVSKSSLLTQFINDSGQVIYQHQINKDTQ
jgi:hypothetical protein